MTRKQPVNLPASVRQRLLNLSRAQGEDFNFILIRYALERFLFRLASSEHAEQFILKGAMLFAVWAKRPHRPTKDLDLLGLGDASPQRLLELFEDLCRVDAEPDGLEFDVRSVRVVEIREDEEYRGRRVLLKANLGNARLALQIDVGFGDVVTPAPLEIEYPTLLELPAPRIRAYPRETVVAEKLQAMVALGMPNTRMKDFYDLQVIGRHFSFDGSTLVRAIRATFGRRKTKIPRTTPTALGDEFATDRDKVTQWKAFLQRNRLEDTAAELAPVVDQLRTFLIPPLFAAASGEAFSRWWPNGGPWA